MVFCLLVELEFESLVQKEAWKSLWSGLAALVRTREQNCLMYEFSDSLEEGAECKAVIFERYVSEADLAAHRESQREFDMNSKWTGGDLVAKRVTKWIESGIGHVAPAAVAAAAAKPPPRALTALRTPCLVCDVAVARRNGARMLARAAALGCTLRPHVKTHKTVEIALIQTGGRRSRITVSSLAEARFFADAGWDDVLYAVPITADKLDEARALSERIVFHIIVDNALQFDAIEAAAPPTTNAGRWRLWVMADCGYHRDGVDVDSEEGVALVRRVEQCATAQLRGIYTHGGHSYGAASPEAVAVVAAAERDAVTKFAATLRRSGLHLAISEAEIAVGSTPTCSRPPTDGKGLDGVTEMHPGNYIYNDVMQLRLGSCTSLDDIAVRVCTRVIGHYPQHRMLLIDCGWTGCSAQGKDVGYGAIEGHPELTIKQLKQEAGEVEVAAIEADGGAPITAASLIERYPIGSILKIAPWHSCAATAMHRVLHVANEAGAIVDEYAICSAAW